MSMSNAQRGLLNEARVDVGYRNLQRGTYATHNSGQASPPRVIPGRPKTQIENTAVRNELLEKQRLVQQIAKANARNNLNFSAMDTYLAQGPLEAGGQKNRYREAKAKGIVKIDAVRALSGSRVEPHSDTIF